MLKSENTVLVKHTAAVHINNILTLNQRKIANILLKNAYHEMSEDKWHFIQIRDLLNQLGWKSSSNSTELIKSDLRALNATPLEWNILKRDKKRVWNITTFLSDSKIENGVIRYSYSLAIREALYNPNIYAKLDLHVQKLFKTKHALVLWEHISCELSSQGRTSLITRWMFLDDLRRIFGLNESRAYSSFNAIKQKILSPSLLEINEKSNVTLSMETKKENRKVVAVRFFATKFIAENKVEENSVIERNIKSLGLSSEKFQKDVSTYGMDRVKSAMEYTRKQIDAGKVINNVAAFYNMALRENWGNVVSSDEIKAAETDCAIKNLVGPEIFVKFMDDLKNRLGEGIFRSWFLDCEFVSIVDDEMTIKASSNFKRDYIQNNFSEKISKTIAENSVNYKVSII